jgi:hypothetical protein
MHYILRVLTLILSSFITHSLVRSDFSALLGFWADLREAHLLKEDFFLAFMVFLLKEGFTTRVCMVISS